MKKAARISINKKLKISLQYLFQISTLTKNIFFITKHKYC